MESIQSSRVVELRTQRTEYSTWHWVWRTQLHKRAKFVCSFPHAVIDLVCFFAVFPCVLHSITHTIVSSSCIRTILGKKRQKQMGNGLQPGSLSLESALPGYCRRRSMVSSPMNTLRLTLLLTQLTPLLLLLFKG